MIRNANECHNGKQKVSNLTLRFQLLHWLQAANLADQFNRATAEVKHTSKSHSLPHWYVNKSNGVKSSWCLYFLQVWFQNARAKFRRNCLYQESVGVDNVSDNSTITSPSVPSPELSHGSLSPLSPNTGTSPSQHTHTHATQNTTALAIHNVHSPMSSEFLYP